MKVLSDKVRENIDRIIQYFLLFMLYAHLGWWLEVIIFYFQTHTFVNRGFLMGPYCSIYGFGCLFITILFGKYRDKPVKLFFLSAIWCSVIEYVVGYAMEIIFGGRWWQYTDANILNINGRVWIVTTILFGVLATILITKIEPLLFKFIEKIPKKFINTVALTIAVIYILDTATTSSFVVGARDKIELINNNDCTNVISDHVWNGVRGIIKK